MLNCTYRDVPAQIPVLLRACARSAFYAPSINHQAASRVTTIKAIQRGTKPQCSSKKIKVAKG